MKPEVMDPFTPSGFIYENCPANEACPAWDWVPGDVTWDIKERMKELLRRLHIAITFFAMRRGQPKIPESPKSVIVATGGNLGGAIISLPMIEAVRHRWPAAHLAVVSNTIHGLEIVKLAGLGDSHHVLPSVSFAKSFFSSEARNVKRNLGLLGAEILIGNHDLPHVFLLSSLRIPVRIGHVGVGPSGNRLPWGNLFNYPVPTHRGENWLASYRNLVDKFQGSVADSPRIQMDVELRSQASRRLQNAGLRQGELAMAIQAGVWQQQTFKQWPLPLLARACSELWKTRKLRPVVLGAPGQEETVSALQSVLQDVEVIDFIGKTTPREAAALLAACAVTISNDSGLMHLSAAVGTPTVAIYGMTDPSITWVYGNNLHHRIVRRSDCLPCYAISAAILASCSGRSCLNAITPKTVVRAVLELLVSDG